MITVQALAAYLLVAMISWVPPGNHDYIDHSREVTIERYGAIAEDVAAVALDPDEEPVFRGELGRMRTALLLASIASFESQYRADVDECRVRGDNGLAVGIFQTHAPPALVCSDRRVAARIALGMVRESFRICRRQDLLDKLSEYTEGRGICRDEWSRSRVRVGRAVYWEKAHPFHLVRDEG